jgi:hypothetical protein
MSTRKMRRSQMRSCPSDAEKYKMIEEAWRLAAEGVIYDTGRRSWSERTQSYQVVWGVLPPKNKRS